MKNYFVWERDFANRWQAVVYHNGKPAKSVNHSEPDRSQFHEIPLELMGGDGQSPVFSELMKKYPAPKELEA